MNHHKSDIHSLPALPEYDSNSKKSSHRPQLSLPIGSGTVLPLGFPAAFFFGFTVRAQARDTPRYHQGPPGKIGK